MPQSKRIKKASLAELARQARSAAPAAWPRLVAALRADGRAGALRLGATLEQRIAALRDEQARLMRLLQFERALWRRGVTHIVGIDEVGVGPLAGPVVAAAVILPAWPPGAGVALWPNLDDSKRLRPALRQRLARALGRHAVAVGIGEVDVAELDAIGIGRASIVAMQRAVDALGIRPEHALIDARRLPTLGCPQTSLIGGDGRSLSIAAASVVAKVHRDALMRRLAVRYPGYGLEQHAGYGTRAHLAALSALGPSAVHRRSFAPVRRLAPLPAQAALGLGGSGS